MKNSILRFILEIFITLSFVECSDVSDNNNETGGTTTTAPTKSLRFMEGSNDRYGNESGYYYTRRNNNDDKNGNPYMNTIYVDCPTKKEVYLCNKNNCAHNDKDCSSYVGFFGCQGMLVYENKLYCFFKEEASSTSSTSMTASTFIPVIYVSDLDGSNSKKLAELTSGTEWSEYFVFGNGMVYVNLEKQELVGDSDGAMNDTIAESNLVSINLSNGKFTKLSKAGGKRMIGAYGNAVDCKDKEISNINLFLKGSNPNIGIDILAELSDRFLVRTGYETKNEHIDWAGVDQDSIIGESLALISKSDFFAGKPQYTEIGMSK